MLIGNSPENPAIMPVLSRLSCLAFLGASLLLAGCATEAERQAAEQAQRAADEQECVNLGFEPQTDAFADCLLKLRELRAMERSGGGLGVGLGVGFGF